MITNNSVTVVGTTYIFDTVMEGYCKKHNLIKDQFIELDNKYKIFAYINEYSFCFTDCSVKDNVKNIENYIKGKEEQNNV